MLRRKGSLMELFMSWTHIFKTTTFFTVSPNICGSASTYLGTAMAQWLRCCATNRKVAGSIPAGVSGFFIDIKSF